MKPRTAATALVRGTEFALANALSDVIAATTSYSISPWIYIAITLLAMAIAFLIDKPPMDYLTRKIEERRNRP